MIQNEGGEIMADEAKSTQSIGSPSPDETEEARRAVDYSLAAEEVMAAIRELHARGGIDDVFGRLFDQQDSETD